MKRNVIIVGIVLILVLSACAPKAAAPTANPVDVQNTAEAAAFTAVAQTQESMPTATFTSLPPTATETQPSVPTLTAIPTLSTDASLGTPTGLPTIAVSTSAVTSAAPTSIPQQNSSATTEDTCNKPLTSWKGPTATFTIKNETKPQGDIVLSLYVVTPLGECGYLTNLSSGPVGTYSAGAFVNGKKNFKVFGGFTVQEGEWKIVVRNDKILGQGSCYPNC